MKKSCIYNKRYKSKQSKEIENIPVIIRQVPGDGNCLFHSLTVGLNFVEKRKHLYMKNQLLSSNWGGSDNDGASDCHDHSLFQRSSLLRQIAVDMLTPTTSTDSSNEDSDGHFGDQGITSKKRQKEAKRNRRRVQNKRKKTLFLQGNEYLHTSDLLHLAASQYDLTGDEYCELMRNDGVWGGGPEIVALCNYLKRPIHVYELVTAYPPAKSMGQQSQLRRGLLSLSKGRIFKGDDSMNGHSKSNARAQGHDDKNDGNHSEFDPNRRKYISRLCEGGKSEFRLRRMACFGSPKFDYKEPIHILSADSRFPDLKPGQEASNGNHFLAIFPMKKGGFRGRSSSHLSSTKRTGFKVRSGATHATLRQEKRRKSNTNKIPRERNNGRGGKKHINTKFKHSRERIKKKHMDERQANLASLFEMLVLPHWFEKALRMFRFR